MVHKCVSKQKQLLAETLFGSGTTIWRCCMVGLAVNLCDTQQLRSCAVARTCFDCNCMLLIMKKCWTQLQNIHARDLLLHVLRVPLFDCCHCTCESIVLQHDCTNGKPHIMILQQHGSAHLQASEQRNLCDSIIGSLFKLVLKWCATTSLANSHQRELRPHIIRNVSWLHHVCRVQVGAPDEGLRLGCLDCCPT